MTRRTHLAVGVAATLFVTQPQNLNQLVVCCGVASIGSVISDIDVSTSGSYRDINKVIGLTILASIFIVLLEYLLNIRIISIFKESSYLMKLLVSGIAFLGVCAFGKEQPHRSFMHSILAVAVLSIVIWNVWPTAMLYFTISMLSHIAIDTLNRKKVRLFYPLKWGFCFKFCYATGFINNMLFFVGGIASAIEILYFLIKFETL